MLYVPFGKRPTWEHEIVYPRSLLSEFNIVMYSHSEWLSKEDARADAVHPGTKYV
jgi:hypothetical protein